MQKIATLFIIALFFCKASCTKNDTVKARVVRDCSGTYLRMNDKDYQVCNLSKVDPFADQAIVSVYYRRLSQCTGEASQVPVCYLLHKNEGWIEVIEIH